MKSGNGFVLEKILKETDAERHFVLNRRGYLKDNSYILWYEVIVMRVLIKRMMK